MSVNKIMCFFASKLKGRDFTLDERIGDLYLLRFSFSYVVGYLRGLVRLRALVFVGRSVSFISSGHLVLGRSVNFGDGCIINALRVKGLYLAIMSPYRRELLSNVRGVLDSLVRV